MRAKFGVRLSAAAAGLVLLTAAAATAEPAAPVGATAQPRLQIAQSDAYRPDRSYDDRADDGRSYDGRNYDGRNYDEQSYGSRRADDAYRPPSAPPERGYGPGSAYNSGPSGGYDGYEPRDGSRGREAPPTGGYGTPYAPPGSDVARHDRDDRYGERYDDRGGYRDGERYDDRTYSQNEIVAAGHGFFGSISKGLASVIEHAFKQQGRPNGYILGEDAGGAFVAGLRYGEGRLYTKNAGSHKVYWQGPSVGYDFGGSGAKTMVLVYNLRDPSDVYHRFAGVEGSAYLVGGVGIQFTKHDDVVMAPIRAGVGLRLGANVGYLKYTRRPTWNPF